MPESPKTPLTRLADVESHVHTLVTANGDFLRCIGGMLGRLDQLEHHLLTGSSTTVPPFGWTAPLFICTGCGKSINRPEPYASLGRIIEPYVPATNYHLGCVPTVPAAPRRPEVTPEQLREWAHSEGFVYDSDTPNWKPGDRVCFAHRLDQAFTVSAVHPDPENPMVELEGMSGEFGAHIFVAAPISLPPIELVPRETGTTWRPLVEVFRTEMMRRFSSRLSMEEIADFSYFMAGELEARQVFTAATLKLAPRCGEVELDEKACSPISGLPSAADLDADAEDKKLRGEQ